MNRTVTAASSSSSRSKGVLLLAAAFGVLSALLMFAFLNSRGGDSGANQGFDFGAGAESVVVLTQDVQVGEVITDQMLGVKTVPSAALLPGHYLDSALPSLVGKVATAPMYAGEQVIEPKVTTYEGQETATWKIPDGMRGISLAVPHESWIVGGLPQPGDRVDIIGLATLMKVDPLTGEQIPDVIAAFIAQDVEILAVSQSVVRTVPKVDGETTTGTGTDVSTTDGAIGETSNPRSSRAIAPGDNSTYESAISITLALPPDLAAKVALLDAVDDDVAQYRIALRKKGDAAPIAGENVFSWEDIFPVR
ncbi:MAG TPA: Flp pilus assembly protein CpaB [Tepidiformaceae bacterium]|nr:Flp pilus assembly protein CpaB [Tepidiformaceae bacterium]HMO96893.1 Flp pilus assembly protein CpaB [Tepidiformaceae bacterium]